MLWSPQSTGCEDAAQAAGLLWSQDDRLWSQSWNPTVLPQRPGSGRWAFLQVPRRVKNSFQTVGKKQGSLHSQIMEPVNNMACTF